MTEPQKHFVRTFYSQSTDRLDHDINAYLSAMDKNEQLVSLQYQSTFTGSHYAMLLITTK